MEIVPTTYYQNLKRYWRRRKYQRRHGTANNKKKLKIARLGGTASGRRQFWRIRTPTKLRFKFYNVVSPIKVLRKFHDAYVDMMIRLASNVGNSNNVSLFGGKRVPKGRQSSMVSNCGEEVDGRFVVEIYKRLVSTRELAAF